ncbi:TPM domain-containing protein [Rhodopseudomonas palustris]|uniref:TPM domain-containing protein n=1 Tax=Rhodopseudomonas palustris (strain BisB18) TaxID=316056 RepID=Q219P0_RHOPB
MRVIKSLLVIVTLCFGFAAEAQVAVPPLTGRVVDKTASLSSEAIARLDQKLQAFEARKGSQIAVLLVPTTQPEAIEQYSLRVAEAWKIGRKKIDDGAILLVAKNDRKLRIEVGYGLEGALNDVTAKRIIDEIITPKFKTGDFAGGVEDGVDKIIGVIDGEALPVPKPQHEWGEGAFNPEDLFNPVLIIAALALSGITRALLGRLGGALATGGLVGVIAWIVAASWITAGLAALLSFVFALFSDALTSGGGGFGGGRSGGGWSGGSSRGSSDSGWSGGGGSFGGGGASGRW